MKFIIPLIFAFNIVISYNPYVEKKVKVYFSSKDNCRKKIIKCINRAKENITFALYFLTDKEIAKALLEANKRGVKIEGILDKQCAAMNKEFILNLKKDLNIKIIYKKYGIMHHKFAIFDKGIVITGSYNWTFSANNRNNENLLIIKSDKLALEYFKEYMRINSKN